MGERERIGREAVLEGGVGQPEDNADVAKHGDREPSE